MNTHVPYRRSFPRALGLTLMELLVALVLTALLLQLLLPLLHEVTSEPPAAGPLTSLSTWRRVLQADLSQAVSPAKSSVAIVELLGPNAAEPRQRLRIETFDRPGQATSRGPTEVLYHLEPAGPQWQLVRDAKGWHDDYVAHHVLLDGIDGWQIEWTGTLVPVQTPSPPTPASTAPSETGSSLKLQSGLLTLRLQRGSQQLVLNLWTALPETAPLAAPATEPQEEVGI